LEQQAALELCRRVCLNVRSVCFLNMRLLRGRSYDWLLCSRSDASPSGQNSLGCIKRSLLPCYATSRYLEAMHACIQNTEQLLGHAGAQLASRPLVWCYGLREDMACFSRPTNWAEAAMFTDGATLITRLPTQVNLKQTPMTCFSMLFVPFSHNACIVWLCHDTQQQ